MSKLKAQDFANALTDGYKYVAKQSDGKIIVFTDKPDVFGDGWIAVGDHFFDPLDLDFGTTDWTKCIVEKQEPFEITKTGLYRTRNGEQAYVYYTNGDDWLYVVEEFGGQCRCNDNGRELSFDGAATEYDIVSEWKD